MPLYEYTCVCGELYVRIVKGNPFSKDFVLPRAPRCACGRTMKKKEVPSSFGISIDKEFVTEHITGEPILVKGKKHHRELLRKHGLRQICDPFR